MLSLSTKAKVIEDLNSLIIYYIKKAFSRIQKHLRIRLALFKLIKQTCIKRKTLVIIKSS